MHAIPTPQSLADTVFVKTLTMEKEAESKRAEELMQQFKHDRAQEMLRVTEEVIKPHMRAWAKQWFHGHGLDVSQLPETPAPEPGALVL
jgi:hypothetical protein